MWNHYQRVTLFVVLLVAFAVNASAQEADLQADLLAVLRSNASVREKSTACRLLAQVATKEAVPVLAELLADEKLSHMARYALETIQDPSVDETLRQALGTVQGRPRLGVIGSLARGVTRRRSRRSPQFSKKTTRTRLKLLLGHLAASAQNRLPTPCSMPWPMRKGQNNWP